MFCPECRSEYLPEVGRCPDCNVWLVSVLPEEPEQEYVELVTVLATRSNSVLLVAKSLLESAGIEYFAQADGLLDVLTPAIGDIKVQVHPDDQAEAREILEGVELVGEEMPLDEEE